MRFLQLIGGALTLSSYVSAQVDSKQVCDVTTKICFQSYTVPSQGITYGIALPTNVTDPYDAIISITAPVKVMWTGFAWRGTMVFNPLTVAWPNGKTSVPSSRFAFQGLPQGYDGAELDLMKGTTTNDTHWTMVARCKGCTSWQGSDGNTAVLNATGITRFAWAQGAAAVQEPANNNSAFNAHDAVGRWIHDLNAARSPNCNSWVSSNLLASVAVDSTSTVSGTAATTMATSMTAKPSGTAAQAAIPATCSGAGTAAFASVLASGWKATKVLGGLTSPRSIVFDTAGNMLVVQSGKGITVHTMGTDGCVTSSKTLVSLNSLNHGITLSLDGKTLYASSMTTGFSWPYTASSQTVGTRTTWLTGMVNGGAHITRTLLQHPKESNLMLVAHGSNDNWDYATGNPKTARSVIKVFDMSKVPSSGFNYVSDGWNAGYGLRNEVGMTFDANNGLWGVENSGDNFKRNGQTDIHQDNPAEKLHYLGTDVTKPNDQWFGYPTCFTVWKPSEITDSKFAVGDWFVVSPNNTFKDSNCKDKAIAPSLNFQAHSAPIDSKFNHEMDTLFVSFHGSWNRNPTTGFKLVAVPFTKGTDGAYKPVAPASSDSGYQDIMSNQDVTKCTGNGPSFSSGCFRPAGLSFDNSSRLYMTSDTSSNGEVWVLGKS